MTVLNKPIIMSKHAQERRNERLRDNHYISWKKDFNSYNVKRMKREGDKLHVWCKGNIHYILQEKKSCYIVLTVIQKTRLDNRRSEKQLFDGGR